MRFPYQSYQVQPSALFAGGVVSRPEVLLRIIGPHGGRFVSALVDTGADMTILPWSVAEAVGATIEESELSQATGFGGAQTQIATGRLEFELASDGQAYHWSAHAGIVAFADPSEEEVILGRAGGLEYFVARFDGDLEECELIPNRSFPGDTGNAAVDSAQ